MLAFIVIIHAHFFHRRPKPIGIGHEPSLNPTFNHIPMKIGDIGSAIPRLQSIRITEGKSLPSSPSSSNGHIQYIHIFTNEKWPEMGVVHIDRSHVIHGGAALAVFA